eukprot:6204012-Pleurochrysis_carterae.AAC.3
MAKDSRLKSGESRSAWRRCKRRAGLRTVRPSGLRNLTHRAKAADIRRGVWLNSDSQRQRLPIQHCEMSVLNLQSCAARVGAVQQLCSTYPHLFKL